MERRRFHPCYRSLKAEPRLDKVPRRPKPKRTISLNKMYLETKIAMLEMVQEGLQLKLDMQNVKEEFVGLLEGYHNYENSEHFEHLFSTEEVPNQWRVPPVDNRHVLSQHDGFTRPVSDPRARVKALYETRKARMHARRDRLDVIPSTSSNREDPRYTVQWEDNYQYHGNSFDRTNTPVLSACSESDREEYSYDYEDRNNNTPTKSSCVRESSYYADQSSSDDPPYVNTLSTIAEENSSSSRNSSNKTGSSTSEQSPELPPRCPLIPKHRYREYLSDKAIPKPGLHDLGEYVTLKAPNQSIVSFNGSHMGAAPSILQSPGATTHSFGGSMFSLVGSESNLLKRDSDNYAKESSVRYAKSDVISELYTSQKSNRSNYLDISYISNISGSSSNGGNSSGSLQTPVAGHPLHSTMIGASFHSAALPLSLCDTDDDSLMNRTNETFDTLDTSEGDIRHSQDARTTVSEPTGFLHKHNVSRNTSYPTPKAYDDSYVHMQDTSNGNYRTPKHQPIPSSHRSRNSSGSKQNQIPQLCSEHGLHLTYGGPCLFEDSFDMLEGSGESDLDFSSVNFNSEYGSKLGSKRSSVASKRSSVASKLSSVISKQSSAIHHNSDCDSSYLSECVDDTHFTNDFSEAENYTALYDSRRGRMKLLRRQVGQGDIKRHKQPIGLSESDLLHDITERHLSLQASRCSVPDIYNLSAASTCSSIDQEEYVHHLESSMHDSTLKSHILTDDENNSFSHNNDTIVSCDQQSNSSNDDIDTHSEQRPVSLCTSATGTTSTTGTTTTDDSPESNGGMTVPVNSPNITDSGGSSSRPTTDAYDYVEVPINTSRVAQLLKNKLTLQQQPGQIKQLQEQRAKLLNSPQQVLYRQQSRSVQSIPRTQRKYTPAYAESQQSQAKTAYSDPILNADSDDMAPRRPRRNQRYPRSQDSGFATHESGRSQHHLHNKTRSHSYDALQPEYPGQKPLAYTCQAHSQSSRHFAISHPEGGIRTVVQHAAVGRNMDKDRKKALARKLKQFNNNFYGGNTNPQIKTLAHF